MADLGENLVFRIEGLTDAPISGDFGMHHLDDDKLIPASVVHEVDDTGRASAKHSHEVVTIEKPCGQRYVILGYFDRPHHGSYEYRQ